MLFTHAAAENIQVFIWILEVLITLFKNVQAIAYWLTLKFQKSIYTIDFL